MNTAAAVVTASVIRASNLMYFYNSAATCDHKHGSATDDTCCACRYFQKLTGTLRRAMAVTMAVSTTANGNLILVSFSVAEGYTDKRGSAQLFVLNGTGSAMRYTYLQDLALLNMPAGEAVDRATS
jgi:hypothetical protein